MDNREVKLWKIIIPSEQPDNELAEIVKIQINPRERIIIVKRDRYISRHH